jgi:L-seryl-tRNA(Ser) seleniumtransferase
MYRALRSDKLTYAALEATLVAYSRGTALKEIPVLRMLSMERGVLEKRTASFVEKLQGRLNGSSGWLIETIENTSVVGGGSAPGIQPASYAVAISNQSRSSDELAETLRTFRTPVISRIHEGKLLLDLRTVFENQEDELFEAVLLLA